MFKRLITLSLSLVMASGLLAGCSGSSGGKEPSTAAPQEGENNGGKVTLKVAFFQGGYGDAWFKWLKEEFEKENQNVTVELEGNPKMNDIIQPRIEANTNVPDVVFVDDSLMRKWGPAGKLVDLTDMYNEKLPDGKTIEEKITDSTDKSMDVFGKKYGVPLAQLSQGIIYNVKMFEDNGWNFPSTWEELEQLAEQIKAKGIAPLIYPGQYPYYLFPFGHASYLQYGGPEFIEKLTNPTEADIPGLYEDPAFKRTFTLLDQMFKDKWMLDGTLALNHTESQMEFLRGKAAMILNGAWLENEMKDSIPEGFQMKMMPFPPAKDAVVHEPVLESLTSGFGGIPSVSNNIETAKKFLQFSSTEEANRRFTELTGSSRAFTYSVEGLNISDFTKSAIEATNKYKTVALIYAPQAITDSPGIDAYAAIAARSKTVEEVIQANVKAAPNKWKENQKLINTK
ncbi:extracellular solute-binding protein [Paenibacillus azoreducens]|uniref:Carbohydrate ABC transporter, N-acetylglucosamine/diacetylchitobiose-binding protein n=1 Tax=Paenibacillus azoreducens TaxID=116718 RepID=A0A920CMA4_9BACL|nr:extracellular solute-binding protein [Paenibacillus azoreducens]GIO46046.1 carbohydrate ABC transporter, N-acetylglucosamine/diacetylchitobiose-binding protein [Paenibacillus azoreducens]